MHSWKTVLFGPNSLIGYIKHKNWLWDRIRKSYRQLQIHQRELEEFLKKPVNQYTSQRADYLFDMILYRWVAISLPKRAFEFTLHKYRLTAPSNLELALYREYLLLANMIKASCKENLAKAGFTYPKSKLVNANFI